MKNLFFCCYLLYFRHVADPENDAISEHVHVRLVVFFKALFWGLHFCDFDDFGCPLGALLGHFWLTFWGHFRVFEKGAPRVIRKLGRYGISAPSRGAQRRHLAKAAWLSHLA